MCIEDYKIGRHIYARALHGALINAGSQVDVSANNRRVGLIVSFSNGGVNDVDGTITQLDATGGQAQVGTIGNGNLTERYYLTRDGAMVQGQFRVTNGSVSAKFVGITELVADDYIDESIEQAWYNMIKPNPLAALRR